MAKPPKLEIPFPHLDDLDALDDTRVIGGVEIPFEQLPAPSSKTLTPADANKAELDIASAKKTDDATRGMQHSDTMRSALDRLRGIEGVGNFDANEANDTDDTSEIGIQPEVNYENLPAVVSRAVALPDQEKIEWHKVENLPGYRSRGIRDLGRNEFDHFTKTPQGDVVTVAYLKPPGNDPIDPMSTQRNPNTPGEVLKVIKWLQSNAKDLGRPDVPEIRTPIRGYKTQLRHFTANGIRFHVMMDSIDDNDIGYYVYAWPEKDSKHPSNGENLITSRKPTKQLRENKNMFDKNKFVQLLRESQIEETKYSQFIDKLVKEFILSEARQSVSEVRGIEARTRRKEGTKGTLTQILKSNLKHTSAFFREPMKKGDEKQELKAGDKFIRYIHKLNQLSDSAIYQPPPARSNGKDIAWMQFKSDPNNFLIVIGSEGMAAIRPTKSETPTVKGVKYKIIFANKDGVLGEREMRNLQAQAGEVETDPTIFKARGGMPSKVDTRNLDNLFDLCSEKIGSIKQENIFFTEKAIQYIATQGGTVLSKKEIGSIEHEKIEQRAKLKQVDSLSYAEARKKLIYKLRPILSKLIKKIQNEVIQDRRSTNNDDEIEKLTKINKKISNILVALDTAGELPQYSDSPIFRLFDGAIKSATDTYSAGDPKNQALMNSILSQEPGHMQQLADILYYLRKELLKI